MRAHSSLLLPVLCLTLLLSLSPAVHPAHAGEEPLLLVSGNYEPYVIAQGTRPGLLSEIVTQAFAEQGIRVEIRFYPWRRCALMVETGEAFAAFPYARTDKRARYAWFSDVIWVCRNVFFYMKGRMGEFDFTTLEALRPYLIAGTSGNYYEEVFREKGLTVDYAPGEASGVRKLWELRTALFAEDELVGRTLIARIFPARRDRFGWTPTPWNLNPQHLMVSKAYPGARELMDRFNAGLWAIRDSGAYDRIVESYLK
ncbi:substrate-binding periplasmic protein [Pseudodesulfovibrio indicus]|uniref:Amino acid ABC transporter substrate-binding protein (PAAT family) n=1 Tax=Pseudodesulfovibrio indicus TaxID=1716143 RepID=A0A126QKL9_9BACT|nr:transporter substrate-binding domain-containing protein [Pseudodesulfovibrio indicus]AMK10501.1 hypothetical protein AWY79_04900 [Pseudodesulfovibrio indicus]TDT89099.1 amino acid ABC transporter substrate-binding protein (PAAT family) [Pseudodesulfovibrio indicus]